MEIAYGHHPHERLFLLIGALESTEIPLRNAPVPMEICQFRFDDLLGSGREPIGPKLLHQVSE
jgi:hypothetical protein